MLTRLPLVLLLLLIVVAARADAPETRVALVIGNSAYVHTAALPNPRADAAAMAAKLRGLGFTVLDGYDRDHAQTRELLRRFADAAATADVALFYYAGHALQVDGQNYLLPVDAQLAKEADLKYETYRLDDLMQDLGQARKLRLAVIDACRDNPLGRRMARTMGTRSAAVRQGTAPVTPPVTDMLIAFATRAGEVAFDGDTGHSPYTAALLQHIGTPGLDVTRMFGKTRDAVLVSTHRKQEPYFYGSLGGETWSFAAAAPTPNPEALAYWDRIRASADPAVFRAFLARFPADPVLTALARERLAVVMTAAAAPPAPAPVPSPVAAPPAVAAEVEASAVPETAAPPDAAALALGRAAEIPPRFIQLALKDLGQYRGPLDGTLGAGSRTAISAWQGGRGLSPTGRLDHRQTLDLLSEAADAGRPQSQNILGMLRARGIGLPQDAAAARAWFEKSAAQGNEHAAFNLGVLYRDGTGVGVSRTKARDYFEQARRGGHPEAAKALARLR